MDEEECVLLSSIKDKCDFVGVTPFELYMRQKGLCHLEIEVVSGEARLYCTDDEDRARTDYLANPTHECSKCMAKFILEVYSGKETVVD
jgi:hypothetical protein